VGKIDTLEIKDLLVEKKEESARTLVTEILSKEKVQDLEFTSGDDYLVIDNNLKNVNYKLAPCCNPIFGDDIFGFVTINEGIKIHRVNCPNAPQMIERYPYRLIKAKWQDTRKKSSFQATIRISGTDEMNIVAQISHVVLKDIGVQMRSINIDSSNGAFDGTLRVFVNGLDHLDFLMNKLRSINGVVSVTRAD
jgi:GTP pyrophosphokinase